MELTLEERMAYSELRILNNRLKRNRELKCRITAFSLGVIFILVVAIYFFSVKGVASDGSDKPLYKYYKSIQIEPGDTLYDLATKYSVDTKAFVSEVIFINSLDNANDIKSGEYIIIPYYDIFNR